MKKNKGFTLVEMILTLALISIVMVGVVAMMRSSSIFYLNGYKEVNLQEEAQIASAQIENMLIDSRSNISSLGSGVYEIHLSDGTDVTLCHDNTNKKLLCKNVSTGDYEPLADYVDSFEITGIYNSATMSKDLADNYVTVSMKMGYPEGSGLADEYTLDKDVYFRNMIEDSSRYDIQTNGVVGTGGAGEDDPEYDYICEVKRYEPVNLEKLYQVTGVSLSPAASYYYDISSNIVQLNSTSTAEYDKAYGDLQDLIATGTGKDGSAKKIKLYTVKVDIKEYSDIFVHHDTVTQNAGFQTYLDVEGININEARKAGAKIEYDMTIYLNGKTSSQTGKEIQAPSGLQAGNANQFQFNFGGPRLEMGLIADPNSPGMVLATNNSTLSSMLGGDYSNYKTKNNNGSDKIQLDIKLYNKNGVVKYTKSRNIKLYFIGNDLTKFQ